MILLNFVLDDDRLVLYFVKSLDVLQSIGHGQMMR